MIINLILSRIYTYFRSLSGRLVKKMVVLLCISAVYTSLQATGTFVDREPLLKKQKVNNEYTYPIALDIETQNYPDVFEVGDFTEVRLFYFQNANHVNPILENHLLLSDKKYRTSFSISKYDQQNSIMMVDAVTGENKVHHFSDQEIWLYAHYSEVSKLVVVYMDSAKDGFIYDCKDRDNEIDRVGIYYPEGLVVFDSKYLKEIPLPNYKKGIKVDTQSYRLNLIRGMRRLHQLGKPFQPFSRTSIKLSCSRNDKENLTLSTKLVTPEVVERNYLHLQSMDRMAANMNKAERNWWSSPAEYQDFNRSDFFANIMNQGSKRGWSEQPIQLVEGGVLVPRKMAGIDDSTE